jgi:uncharacterized repeat protein (TIGR03803 family)
MSQTKRFRTLFAALGRTRAWIVVLSVLLVAAGAAAQTSYEVVHASLLAGQPYGSLIQGNDGYLYGTTSHGGTFGAGTVFRMDTSGILTTLHSFTLADGSLPSAALVQAADGNLYGTASAGGPASAGVVFRLILGGAFQVTGVAPTSGSSSGGTAVSITGLGFESTDTVSFGGIAATGVNVVSPTQIDAMTPPLSPGALHDLVVTKLNLSSALLSKAFFADFLDVPQSDIFHDYVEKIFRAGITAGCGGGDYCRDNPVRRDQMPVFLLKAEHGSSYVPPACSGYFTDVDCPGPFTDWIEQLANEGVTGLCDPLRGYYCPHAAARRSAMAAYLLKTEHGPSYTPPACTGIFGDVSCPSPPLADWIEQLYAEQVTGGCQTDPLLYCPGSSVTRGQMAVFLVKTFGLE